jgi:hypothetical protein
MNRHKEAIEVVQKYGFRVVKVERKGNLHIHTEPEYRFIAPCTPSDWRGILNFESQVRATALSLGMGLPGCPTVSCKYMQDEVVHGHVTITRCTKCSRSMFVVDKGLATETARPLIPLDITSSPSSAPR